MLYNFVQQFLALFVLLFDTRLLSSSMTKRCPVYLRFHNKKNSVSQYVDLNVLKMTKKFRSVLSKGLSYTFSEVIIFDKSVFLQILI